MHSNSIAEFEYLKLIPFILNYINKLLRYKCRRMYACDNQTENQSISCLVKQVIERKLKNQPNPNSLSLVVWLLLARSLRALPTSLLPFYNIISLLQFSTDGKIICRMFRYIKVSFSLRQKRPKRFGCMLILIYSPAFCIRWINFEVIS